jgi:hypothetical protein
MGLHGPRFRLSGLIVLVAVVAVEFALLPRSCSPGVAVLTLVSAIWASVMGPLMKRDWVAIVVIHGILIALLAPAMKHSHGKRRGPAPAATGGPRSGKI